MTDEQAIRIRIATWSADGAAIARVRRAVFVDEQGFTEEEEFDGLDDACRHALALDQGNEPVGTGRLLIEGRIGRVAVLEPWRGRGVGALLMETMAREAERLGMARLFLHAQIPAIPFYERLGYAREGEPFQEDGIPHCLMTRSLAPSLHSE